MLSVDNATPYAVAAIPYADKHGRDGLAVVAKGTFEIAGPGEPVALADEQEPVAFADAWHGEPGASSLRYAADSTPPKPGADVALVGHAYPPTADAREFDVSLQVGERIHVVRVFGDRHWERGLLGWRPTPPEPVERVPLVYERAFGGADLCPSDPAKHAFEPRNPVGTGFVGRGGRERLRDLALPNLEDPGAPIGRPKDRPAPAGFGFVAPAWSPRAERAGTYDDAWQRDRCPLLPLDFDERFFHAAHPALCSPQPLAGGERVRIVNASRDGTLDFRLPAESLAVTAWIRGEPVRGESRLDTVVIEPDARRLVAVWRAAIPCPRTLLYVQYVFVKRARDARGDARAEVA